MDAVKTFFAFHKRPSMRDLWSGAESPWSTFGHVSAYGFTRDNTWFFFDPQRVGTKLQITHHHDEIDERLTSIFILCDEVYCTDYQGKLWFPPVLPMNCVMQCAHLIGTRAFTPNGFRQKLRGIGAERIHAGTTRESGRQG